MPPLIHSFKMPDKQYVFDANANTLLPLNDRQWPLIKNLSLNNITFTKSNESASKHKQADVCRGRFFKAHKQLAKPIHPRMADFNNPTTSFEIWIA